MNYFYEASNWNVGNVLWIAYDEFEATKRLNRIRNSKDRQRNGQRKKDKRTNNDLHKIFMNKTLRQERWLTVDIVTWLTVME